jgi:hypothetical protein
MKKVEVKDICKVLFPYILKKHGKSLQTGYVIGRVSAMLSDRMTQSLK